MTDADRSGDYSRPSYRQASLDHDHGLVSTARIGGGIGIADSALALNEVSSPVRLPNHSVPQAYEPYAGRTNRSKAYGTLVRAW